MFNLKKTVVMMLVTASYSVYSGTMGPVCQSTHLKTPCASKEWVLGAKALYLLPKSTAGDYSFVAKRGDGRLANYPNAWSWGFKLDGAYHYGTGRDVNLNWYHINHSSKKTYAGEYAYSNYTTTLAGVMTPSVHPQWDAVNIEMGQHFDLDETKSIRFHGGAQYARVVNTVTINVTDALLFSNTKTDLEYNGFGPRLGADMNYQLGYGFNIYANGAASLLVGHDGMSRLSLEVTPTENESVSTSLSQTIVVPELDAKLGINYNYALAQGRLTADLGWMWANYFNVQQSVLYTNTDVINGDFNLQGLIFGLTWLGDIV